MKCIKRVLPLALIAVAILVILYSCKPKPHRDPTVPEPPPICPDLPPVCPEPSVTWESVDSGYGCVDAKYGLTVDHDKAKGGWRIFKSSEGDYKIIYSVDEWELVSDSKSYFESTGVKLQKVTTDHGVISPEREPWWLYYNNRTGEAQFVYRDAQQPYCPDGNCPLTQSTDDRLPSDANSKDTSRRNERGFLQGWRK